MSQVDWLDFNSIIGWCISVDMTQVACLDYYSIIHSKSRYISVDMSQVAWLDYNSFPLTFEDRRVIDDSRFSVVRTNVKDWNLQVFTYLHTTFKCCSISKLFT